MLPTPPSPHYTGSESTMERSESRTESPLIGELQQRRSVQNHFRVGYKASWNHYLVQTGQLILASEANSSLNIYCLCTREEGKLSLPLLLTDSNLCFYRGCLILCALYHDDFPPSFNSSKKKYKWGIPQVLRRPCLVYGNPTLLDGTGPLS